MLVKTIASACVREWAGEAATEVRSAGNPGSRGWYAATSGRVHSIVIAAQMRPCALIPVRARPFMAAPALLRRDDIARTREVSAL